MPILFDEESRRRLDAMARVFTKTDRVLSGEDVVCTVHHDGRSALPAPSWTDGKTITFNKKMIGDVASIEDIIRLSGLNYHELAHVLLTPRQDTVVVKQVQANRMHIAFNMLEDQRIETFLTAMYPSIIPYLVSTVMRFCVANESQWKTNFPLIFGRKYLPKDVRDEFKRRFARQDLVPQFEDIITEYRKVTYPNDELRAIELITAYHALLRSMKASGLTPQDPNGHSTEQRPDLSEGDPLDQDAQDEASATSDYYDDAFDDEDADDSQAGAGGDADAPDDDTDDDTEDGEGDSGTKGTGDISEDTDDDDADGMGSGDGEDTDDDADGEADSGADGDASDSADGDASDGDGDSDDTADGGADVAGSGTKGNDQPRTSDEVREMLDDYIKAYETLDDVVKDAESKQRVIVRGDGDVTIGTSGIDYQKRAVKDADLQAVRSFSRVLDQLRSDADPGWKTHQSSGRINMKRAIHNAPMDELWDQWEEGNNDAADIEAVIVIDNSGSMRDSIDSASRAMWSVKRAMETLGASVTVLSYGSKTVLVYDRHEKSSRNQYKAMSAGGGTRPREAIIEAVRILTTTKRRNRIFIAITDGNWDTQEPDERSNLDADGLIAQMGAHGITTALAFIGSYSAQGSSHKCQVSTNVSKPEDLTAFAKQIVRQTMLAPRK